MSEAQPDPGHLEFLDRLVGGDRVAATPAVAVPTFALYARVSTEDLQDPEGSLRANEKRPSGSSRHRAA